MSGPKFRVLTTILQYGTVQHSAVYDVKSSAHCILSVWSSEVQEQLDNNKKKDRAIGSLFFIQETGIRFSHHMPSGQGKKELLSLSRGTIQHTTATTATYATLLLKKLAAAASTTTTTNYTEMK